MIGNKLIKWYQVNKRKLPWRETKDPYKIWISEIMLQQTQVTTVIPYYLEFINFLPTVNELSMVSDDTLLKLWEGLGYYSRARHLKEAANTVMNTYGGVFPNTYEDLKTLKGIGEYTAGAILSIAYEKKYPAVDGNVIRVISRIYGIKDDISLTKTKAQIKELTLKNMVKPYSEFTQSLMDFGSLICKKSPLCSVCPLKEVCIAYKEESQLRIPYTKKKVKKEEIPLFTFVIKNKNNEFILEKESNALLKGLYLYPQVEAENLDYAIERLEDKGIFIDEVFKTGHEKHIFTHKIWNMSVVYGYGYTKKDHVKTQSLDRYPMPTAHKKITTHHFDSGK